MERNFPSSTPDTGRRTLDSLLAVAKASAKDALFRGATIAVVGIVTVLMIFTRLTAIYGFGEETNLLLEFGLANLTAGGALLAVLCAIPVRRAKLVLAADRVLVTRSMSPTLLYAGRWLGSCVVLLLAYVLWTTALVIALVWFAKAEPTMFTLNRPTTISAELGRIVLPVIVIYLQSVLLAAVATALAVRGGMMAPVLGVVTLLLLGVLLPDAAASEDAPLVLKGVAWLVPDLRASSVSESLYGSVGNAGHVLGVVLQTLGYGLVAILLGSRLVLRG